MLDDHCGALGRDPSTITRSAQALILADAPGIDAPEPPPGLPSIRGTAPELRDQMARYVEAGVDEFIVSDATTGHGTARRSFLDWFANEVAAPYR